MLYSSLFPSFFKVPTLVKISNFLCTCNYMNGEPVYTTSKKEEQLTHKTGHVLHWTGATMLRFQLWSARYTALQMKNNTNHCLTNLCFISSDACCAMCMHNPTLNITSVVAFCFLFSVVHPAIQFYRWRKRHKNHHHSSNIENTGDYAVVSRVEAIMEYNCKLTLHLPGTYLCDGSQR